MGCCLLTSPCGFVALLFGRLGGCLNAVFQPLLPAGRDCAQLLHCSCALACLLLHCSCCSCLCIVPVVVLIQWVCMCLGVGEACPSPACSTPHHCQCLVWFLHSTCWVAPSCVSRSGAIHAQLLLLYLYVAACGVFSEGRDHFWLSVPACVAQLHS